MTESYDNNAWFLPVSDQNEGFEYPDVLSDICIALFYFGIGKHNQVSARKQLFGRQGGMPDHLHVLSRHEKARVVRFHVLSAPLIPECRCE